MRTYPSYILQIQISRHFVQLSAVPMKLNDIYTSKKVSGILTTYEI